MEILMTVVAFVLEWAEPIAAAVGVAAMVAAKTKNSWDNRVAQFMSDALNYLGQNYGKAKNVPDE